MSSFALGLKPPYYAVIFASQRTDGDSGYAATAQRMAELAAQQPGYLGAESTRDAAGFGITVAYYDSLEAIAAWRRHAEHSLAREQGRERWYQHFEVRIAKNVFTISSRGLLCSKKLWLQGEKRRDTSWYREYFQRSRRGFLGATDP